MKRVLTTTILILLSVSTLFSQEINLDTLETAFDEMGKDLSSSVASSATTGLVWSDAYVGNFPHFGIGLFSGAQVIPVDAFTDVLDVVDDNASLPSQLKDIGVPVPAFGIDARLGGFVLPFDIGAKFAMVNDLSIDKVTFNYMLFGGDVRYAILKGNAVLPKISAGVGFSRLTSEITVDGILDGDYNILSVAGETLALKNPDLVYGWESNVLEFKAQISKDLVFITPHVGVNAGYATTKIGGGVKTAVLKNGVKATQSEIDTLVDAANTLGTKTPDIDSTGFESYTTTTAWTVKVVGGTSFNIAVVKIDLSANYDLVGKTYGGQLGFRVQL